MARRANFETVLDADTGPFTRALRRGQETFARFRAGLSKGILAIGASMALLGRNALVTFDRIGKLSKQFGLSTTTIQRFKFVAEQSGASIEQVGKAMSQANRAAQEARRGLKTYGDAFAVLNIDLKEFAGADQEEQWLLLADAIRNATDRNAAFAAGQTIMGRSFRELGPILELSRDEFAKLADQIKPASAEAVAAVERWNDAINRLRTNLGAFAAERGAMLINLGGRPASSPGGTLPSLAESIEQFFTDRMNMRMDPGDVSGSDVAERIRERRAMGLPFARPGLRHGRQIQMQAGFAAFAQTLGGGVGGLAPGPRASGSTFGTANLGVSAAASRLALQQNMAPIMASMVAMRATLMAASPSGLVGMTTPGRPGVGINDPFGAPRAAGFVAGGGSTTPAFLGGTAANVFGTGRDPVVQRLEKQVGLLERQVDQLDALNRNFEDTL
jgi:hypothetical protein